MNTVKPAPVSQTLSQLHRTYSSARYYLNFSNPFELLVATILSAQCLDSVVNQTTKELFKKYWKPEDYLSVPLPELQKDIRRITFFQNKAKYIQAACLLLVKQHHRNVPNTMAELTKLPGIGRKTANAILQNAFDVVEGVIVDTHVLRIAYRLGWTRQRNPEKVEKDLMAIVPKSEWKTLPHLFKDHGRAVCKAPIPTCSQCVLAGWCPKAGVTKSA